MSKDLDEARRLANLGEYKKAIRKLWVVEAGARSDVVEARALLDLADELRGLATGGVQRDAELLAGYAQSHIGRLTTTSPTTTSPVSRNRVSCQALGGFGWPLTPGQQYELGYDANGVSIYEIRGSEAVLALSYVELLAVDIGGPGASTTGGGFAGGGFGLEGAG